MITAYLIVREDGSWRIAGADDMGPEIIEEWCLSDLGHEVRVRVEIPIDPGEYASRMLVARPGFVKEVVEQ